MAEPAWLAVTCPRCGAEPGAPCWRTYPVLPTTMRATETPVLGYCTARPVAARQAREAEETP